MRVWGFDFDGHTLDYRFSVHRLAAHLRIVVLWLYTLLYSRHLRTLEQPVVLSLKLSDVLVLLDSLTLHVCLDFVELCLSFGQFIICPGLLYHLLCHLLFHLSVRSGLLSHRHESWLHDHLLSTGRLALDDLLIVLGLVVLVLHDLAWSHHNHLWIDTRTMNRSIILRALFLGINWSS